MHPLVSRLGLLICLMATSAQADVVVIVNASNPVHALSVRQVAELYLGRTRSFENGELAALVDQGRDDPLRELFFKGISGMSLGQVTAYWARLKFTGQVQPPQVLEGDAAVLDFVRHHPGAVGYVSRPSANDAKVKTVLTLKD